MKEKRKVFKYLNRGIYASVLYFHLGKKKVKLIVVQWGPTLCDPMECSPPSSSVHGILQARILEWIAIPFSRGSS